MSLQDKLEAEKWKAAYHLVAAGLTVADAERVAAIASQVFDAAVETSRGFGVSLHETIEGIAATMAYCERYDLTKRETITPRL